MSNRKENFTASTLEATPYNEYPFTKNIYTSKVLDFPDKIEESSEEFKSFEEKHSSSPE